MQHDLEVDPSMPNRECNGHLGVRVIGAAPIRHLGEALLQPWRIDEEDVHRLGEGRGTDQFPRRSQRLNDRSPQRRRPASTRYETDYPASSPFVTARRATRPPMAIV